MALCLVALGAAAASRAADVKIDHLGYRCGGAKLAVVSWSTTRGGQKPFAGIGPSTPFHLTQGGRTVLAGTLTGPWKDEDTGDTVFHADFSAYAGPGRGLRVEVPGLHPSDEFDVADDPFRPALYLAMRGYYYQRCGMTLEPKYAVAWTHGACHRGDVYFYFKEEGRGHRPSPGGWHDAGDYGRKMMTAGPTVGILLTLCELFPGKIAGLRLDIPESGNGIPDILNEVRYELDWMLTMQESDGGVHHEINPNEFQFSPPDRESPPYYFWCVSSFATADLAGAMAFAARVYRPWDPAFADRCLKSAELAWRFLERHPGVVPRGGVKQGPPAPPTLGYADNDDSDERFWAASELYRTTGAAKYQTYARDHATADLALPYWQNVRAHGAIALILARHPGADEALRGKMRAQFMALADREFARVQADPYRTGQDGYWWGSNSEVMCRAVVLLLAREFSGIAKYLDGAEDLLHYVLGRNALDVCFLAGASAKSVKHIHNCWQASAGIAGAIPGLFSGGPNHAFEDDVIRLALPATTPPARCFVDEPGCYSCNENDIMYSAPLVFVAGYLHFKTQ
jgi:endoglucanase